MCVFSGLEKIKRAKVGNNNVATYLRREFFFWKGRAVEIWTWHDIALYFIKTMIRHVSYLIHKIQKHFVGQFRKNMYLSFLEKTGGNNSFLCAVFGRISVNYELSSFFSFTTKLYNLCLSFFLTFFFLPWRNADHPWNGQVATVEKVMHHHSEKINTILNTFISVMYAEEK